MKKLFSTLCLVLPTVLAIQSLHAQDDEVFEYNAEFNPITGDDANLGGFIFPMLFVDATGGLTGDGVDPTDLATSEHDPQNEFGIQAIELHLGIDLNGVVTGGISGTGGQGADEWEAELEEAFLHYHVNDWLAVGGGQFLNRFGFQSDRHLHNWDFVNQNLVNSRLLNEGELITHGGEVILNFPSQSEITIGGGGVRTHAHDHDHNHGHGEEEGHHEIDGHHEEEVHGHEDEHSENEEHHLEADDANFNSWVLSVDWKQQLPFDESATVSASFATGENGFERQTRAYGVGLEKFWGAHDHGNGPEFCTGAVVLRSEFIGRTIGIQEEDGDRFDANDYGFSTALVYGLSDSTNVSLRHDWVSDLDELELEDRHRISPAITAFLDKNQRIQARLQYDYNHSDSLGDEHAAWLQIQIQWGGQGGRHHCKYCR